MRWTHALALAAVVAAAHAPSLTGGFHYDDDHGVVANPHIRSLAAIPSFFVDAGAFSADSQRAMYRPVLLASYALGYALHGLSATGFLAVNLALHAANAVLVAWIALHLLRRSWAGLLAGALFGLHPVATEPVHYVSARSDSLVALFFLLAVALWLAASRCADGRGAARQRWGSRACAAAALWTKSTAVVLPALLLGLDVLRGDRDPRALIRRHGPLWLLAGLYLACAWGTGFLPRSLAAPALPAGTRLLTQVEAGAWYLRLLAWPLGQSVEPAFAVADGVSPTVVAAAALLLMLAAVAVPLARHLPTAQQARGSGPFLLAWAGLALLPAALAPLNVLVNERRAYLPLAAFAIGASLLLGDLARRHAWSRAMGALLLVAFAVLAHRRGGVWASELSLWQDAVHKGPQMPRAQLYLGDARRTAAAAAAAESESRAQAQLAQQAYQRVVDLQPRQRLLALQAENGMAILEYERGQLDVAEGRLRRVLAEHPEYADGLANLGNVCFARARGSGGADGQSLQRAIQLYQRALSLAPSRYPLRLNLGAALHLSGDLPRAQAEYEAAQARAPEDGVLAMNLGSLYLQRGRSAATGERRGWYERSRAQWERATALLPGSAAARLGLAAVTDSLAAFGGGR